MVPSITTVLQRFSGEWAALLQPNAILTVCREMGYTAWRDRVLTPVITVQLVLPQILSVGSCMCMGIDLGRAASGPSPVSSPRSANTGTSRFCWRRH